MSLQHEIDALLRQDFVSFVHRVFQTVAPGEVYLHNWHIEAIAFELMRIANGENSRLITTLPPRHHPGGILQHCSIFDVHKGIQ